VWDRVKQTITQFPTRVWRDGALMGTTPEQAFFVRIDSNHHDAIFRVAQTRGRAEETEV
jgi:phage tail sheath protein FI